MITIAYHTLGCKVNQYETEKIREVLENAGFQTVPFTSQADAYIINTCSVTQIADSKSRAAVRRALRTNPDAYVVVSGCYAELEPAQVAAIEGVDLVVSNEEKDAIPERLIARFGSNGNGSGKAKPRVRTRAVVKVQDGCDQFCAYCVIPYARSHKTSRPVDEVLAELRTLADYGYKEVVLTGIRLGSYQHADVGLPELILRCAEVDGIERIRLSSIEPWEVNETLLDVMKHPKVCRHLHIPLQSGADDTLRRMNRPYDTAQYLDTISLVRDRIPGIGITTDVIVGFPGETNDAFDNTCRTIEKAAFSRIHVFRYSARERTVAAEMSDQVDPEVRKTRGEKLGEIGKLAVARFAESVIGQTLKVLVEKQDGESKHLTGFADNYIEVVFPGDASLKGRIVEVKITSVDQDGKAQGFTLS